MARDHYQVLGLSPDASPDDIRRAYRTLCLHCHPDKNQGVPNADAAFQELSDAYRTLSSAAARAEYDRMREYVPSSPDDPFADYAYRRHFAEALAKSVREAEGQHVDPDTLFESLFGRARTQSAQVAPDAKQKHQEASAEDVATACTTSTAASSTTTTPSSRSCASAAGLDPGMDSATTAQAGSTRHDAGQSCNSQEWREKGPDREIELPLTLEELYAGCVKKRRLRKHVYDAQACNFVERTDLLTVTVQPGYRPGDRIRFHEASDEGIGTIPADVVYIITQLPHPRFTAVGSDLRLYVHVALVDALAGAVLQIETISGEVVQVRTSSPLDLPCVSMARVSRDQLDPRSL
jgi:DnaJ homolog subfamily B member 4